MCKVLSTWIGLQKRNFVQNTKTRRDKGKEREQAKEKSTKFACEIFLLLPKEDFLKFKVREPK